MPPNTGQYFTRISFTTHNYTAVPPGISGLINVLSYFQKKNMRCWDSGCDGTKTRDNSCFEGVWTVFLQNLHLLLPSVLNNSSLLHKIIQYILDFCLGVLFIFKAYKFVINYNGFRVLQKTDVQKEEANYKSGAKHRWNSDDSVWSFRFREQILCTHCLGRNIHTLFILHFAQIYWVYLKVVCYTFHLFKQIKIIKKVL